MADLNMKILLLLIFSALSASFEEFSEEEDSRISNRVLSRRKRYLTFPDGSSFQLVICEQTHGYLQIGDIVWFGNTAALAWELPSDPKYFHIFKGHEKEFIQNRNGVSKSIYYLDEDGKVLSKIPYHKKFIVNPAFAKRSIETAQKLNNNTISIKSMHEKQKNMSYFKDLDSDSIEFHREGRKDFYMKLQIFLKSMTRRKESVPNLRGIIDNSHMTLYMGDWLGLNGQECILRMLCDTSLVGHEQGTFFEEIMRATFTFPRGKQSTPYHLYDGAHSTKNCGNMYPECVLASKVLK